MTTAFADTAFFVAFLNARDHHHSRAVDLMESHAGRIVTSEWVLAELGNYLSSLKNRGLFVSFARDLPSDSRFEIMPAQHSQFEAGRALFESRSDKEWSMTDCISMVLMEERGVREILTCDHHFEQAGYSILMT